MRGMATCEVCGREFALIIEDHYIARDCEKKGVLASVGSQTEATLYDAYDCPHCGSQNVMQERKTMVFGENECPCDFGICSECKESNGEPKVTSDHDGCEGCFFESVEIGGYPCKECKYSYVDKYKPKEEGKKNE